MHTVSLILLLEIHSWRLGPLSYVYRIVFLQALRNMLLTYLLLESVECVTYLLLERVECVTYLVVERVECVNKPLKLKDENCLD